MRPNQPNKNRSRGRNNNNNRKNANPLSRNYESNGPDVKVRGNAAHIAERYSQLARDAQSMGDSVMAENYFQHAEHYFRILSAAQASMPQPRHDQSNAEQPSVVSNTQTPSEAGGNSTAMPDASPTSGDTAPVVKEAADKDAAVEADGGAVEEKPVRPKTRRPRRKKIVEPAVEADGNKQPAVVADNAGDPTTAPQPDVGELPAFLTGAPTRAAE